MNTGAAHALVRLGPNPTVNQINSAWTLRGLQGCAMALVLAAVAPLAAIYFHEPRVAPIIWVVSVGLAFMGFSNIGMTLAYRDLQFAVEFKLALYTKLTSVLVTLLTAWYFADYRALVSGILAGFIMEWVLSLPPACLSPPLVHRQYQRYLGHFQMVADHRYWQFFPA